MTDDLVEGGIGGLDAELSSQHESGSSPPGSPVDGSAGEDRSSRRERPDWVADVPGTLARGAEDASGAPERGRQSGDSGDDAATEVVDAELVEEADRLTPLLLARLEQHLHLPIQMPNAEAMAALREKDPKGHKVWLKQVSKQMSHQRFMESAHFRMPLRVIICSQAAALISLVVIAVLAGYALYLDRPWIASALAVLDLGAIMRVFTGWRPFAGDEDELD